MVSAIWCLVVPVVLGGSPMHPPVFEGEAVLREIVQKIPAKDQKSLPIGELMVRVADNLRGTPYVGWTLERDVDREFCFVSLEGLDCVTFFETTLNVARAMKMGNPSADSVRQQVQRTRYRGGVVTDYLSRLHYTSDWMFDNARKGYVRQVSSSLPGAELFSKPLNFMSEHASVYRQLKAHPEWIPALRKIEAEISARKTFYVPLARVAAAESRLKSGDIIGITTSAPGMDCSHTGLIVVQNRVPHFMHASSTQKKVVLDVRLSEYLTRHPKATGIMVVRPREVK